MLRTGFKVADQRDCFMSDEKTYSTKEIGAEFSQFLLKLMRAVNRQEPDAHLYENSKRLASLFEMMCCADDKVTFTKVTERAVENLIPGDEMSDRDIEKLNVATDAVGFWLECLSSDPAAIGRRSQKWMSFKQSYEQYQADLMHNRGTSA